MYPLAYRNSMPIKVLESASIEPEEGIVSHLHRYLLALVPRIVVDCGEAASQVQQIPVQDIMHGFRRRDSEACPNLLNRGSSQAAPCGKSSSEVQAAPVGPPAGQRVKRAVRQPVRT